MQSKWVKRRVVLKEGAVAGYGPPLEERWIEWGKPQPEAEQGYHWMYTQEERPGVPNG
jgi:hypothetical protein